jgi:hypothetical protein
MIEATLNYLAGIPERPFFYLYDPPPGTPGRNTKGDRRRVAIHDARRLPSSSLDRGFELGALETSVENLYDADRMQRSAWTTRILVASECSSLHAVARELCKKWEA